MPSGSVDIPALDVITVYSPSTSSGDTSMNVAGDGQEATVQWTRWGSNGSITLQFAPPVTLPEGATVTGVQLVTVAYRSGGGNHPAYNPSDYFSSQTYPTLSPRTNGDGTSFAGRAIEPLPIGAYAGEIVKDIPASVYAKWLVVGYPGSTPGFTGISMDVQTGPGDYDFGVGVTHTVHVDYLGFRVLYTTPDPPPPPALVTGAHHGEHVALFVADADATETSAMLHGPDSGPWFDVHRDAFAVPPKSLGVKPPTVSMKVEVGSDVPVWTQVFAQWYAWGSISVPVLAPPLEGFEGGVPDAEVTDANTVFDTVVSAFGGIGAGTVVFADDWSVTGQSAKSVPDGSGRDDGTYAEVTISEPLPVAVSGTVRLEHTRSGAFDTGVSSGKYGRSLLSVSTPAGEWANFLLYVEDYATGAPLPNPVIYYESGSGVVGGVLMEIEVGTTPVLRLELTCTDTEMQYAVVDAETETVIASGTDAPLPSPPTTVSMALSLGHNYGRVAPDTVFDFTTWWDDIRVNTPADSGAGSTEPGLVELHRDPVSRVYQSGVAPAEGEVASDPYIEINVVADANEGATHWRPVLLFSSTDSNGAEPTPLPGGTKVYLDCEYVPDNGLDVTNEPYLDGDEPGAIWEGEPYASTSIYGEDPPPTPFGNLWPTSVIVTDTDYQTAVLAGGDTALSDESDATYAEQWLSNRGGLGDGPLVLARFDPSNVTPKTDWLRIRFEAMNENGAASSQFIVAVYSPALSGLEIGYLQRDGSSLLDIPSLDTIYDWSSGWEYVQSHSTITLADALAAGLEVRIRRVDIPVDDGDYGIRVYEVALDVIEGPPPPLSLSVGDAVTVAGFAIYPPAGGAVVHDGDPATYAEFPMAHTPPCVIQMDLYDPSLAGATSVTMEVDAEYVPATTDTIKRLQWRLWDSNGASYVEGTFFDPVAAMATYTKVFDAAYFAPGGEGETEDYVPAGSAFTFTDFLAYLGSADPWPRLRLDSMVFPNSGSNMRISEVRFIVA